MVSFGKIEIREYSRILGINPATTHGPPLTIDWKYSRAATYSLDDYEETRPPRRAKSQMMLPGSLRESIILEQTDATKRQISSVISEVKAARHRRKMSRAMQEFEEWQIVWEAVQRRLRRIRRGVSKKREEELLWEKATTFMEEKQKQDDFDDSATEDLSSDMSRTTCPSPEVVSPNPANECITLSLLDLDSSR
jgi:hypothetical protein